MFDFDQWQEIFSTLNRHKLRTLLTAFGVFWGIFLLVLLLAVGRGIEKGVYANFGDLARNSFFIWGERTQLPYKGLNPGRWIRLTNEDVAALRQNVPEIQYLAANYYLGAVSSNRGNKSGSFEVIGQLPDSVQIEALRLQGRFLNAVDIAEYRKVAVIGQSVKNALFGEEAPFGQYLNLKGSFFQVVGVFTPKTSRGGERDSERILIPLTTLQRTFQRGEQSSDRIHNLAVVVASNASAAAIETRTKELLKRRHAVAPDDNRAIGSWNAGKMFENLQNLFRGIRVFLWVVGAGTIVAGIVGVSNIMLIIVKERTREIGIRKALGATPFAIVSSILQEAIFLTAVSGYLGLTASVGLIELAGYLMDKFQLQSAYFDNPEIEFTAAIVATILLGLTGAAAGFIPARHAAAINPIEALRSE